MVKYNYFDALESLSECAYKATFAACSESSMNAKKTISEIRAKADDTLLSLEKSLFSDFLPPLERDDIAAYAHTLSSVVDTAAEHSALCSYERSGARKSAEETICLQIADKIKESTAILKKIKSQSDMPDIQKFRQLLREGVDSHSSEVSRISFSVGGITQTQKILSTARLRRDLSRCFDCLLEVILNNI